jgi:hypothetical protein
MHAYTAYLLAYVTMFSLCKAHGLKAYNKYTGWVRLQIVACCFCLPDPIARDLIWNNAFGCLFGIHLIYSLDRYELLRILAGRSLEKWGIHHSSFTTQLAADFVVHGLPAVLAWFFLRQSNEKYAGQPYLWVITGIPHSTYCFVLTGSWDPTELYKVKKYPLEKTVLVWPAILLGHYTAFLLRPYCLQEL